MASNASRSTRSTLASSDEAGTSSPDRTQANTGGFTSEQLSQIAGVIGTIVDKKLAANKPSKKRGGEDAAAKAKRQKTKGNHVLSDSDSEDRRSEGELSEDEADTYMNDLDELMKTGETTGPELSERIIRVWARTIGTPVESRTVKEKRAAYPRPSNAPTLKVPGLDKCLHTATTPAGRVVDKKLMELQANMTAAMASVAKQADVIYELKTWAKSKEEPAVRDKVDILSRSFIELMDANILLTRAMSDATHVRREVLKLTLTTRVATLLTDDNPATPEWLGGGGGYCGGTG